jgi:hypothetical protein
MIATFLSEGVIVFLQIGEQETDWCVLRQPVPGLGPAESSRTAAAAGRRMVPHRTG